MRAWPTNAAIVSSRIVLAMVAYLIVRLGWCVGARKGHTALELQQTPVLTTPNLESSVACVQFLKLTKGSDLRSFKAG